ncbi:MAG: aminoacyl-histidine dipeptidase [Deltaproteobacteria bacterium]|nr:aminoacyl-histidine dipeptidase [Deltaproteobacteria bacterium]MCB9488682.1 aminoacyl-histidine dipeptidase [Deltaproteobacteria bacterium]
MTAAKSAIEGLEPASVFKLFEKISQIPRGSKKETAISEYIRSRAEECGLAVRSDKAGNLCIAVAATPGCEGAPIVVLQGHVDMVQEKNADTEFDFDKDPIRLVRDGNWLKADGTTLGADNGLGVAAALAIAFDQDKKYTHGPLEILLTMDEETGLTGATNLSEQLVKGRILINLDSEETGILYIGCAGGAGIETRLPIEWTAPGEGQTAVRLHLTGLRGGHSGANIHENRGNAVKLLARTILALKNQVGAQLADFRAGDKHNAIPREGTAILVVDEEKLAQARVAVWGKLAELRDEYPDDKDLGVTIDETDLPERMFTAASRDKALDLLLALPNGVLAMSREIAGLVETSTNVAAAHVDGLVLKIGNSPRSSQRSAMRGVINQTLAVCRLAGSPAEVTGEYPGWQPKPDAAIVKLVAKAHEEVLGAAPKIKAIHAGLECGIIGEKFKGMDMISFGPDIINAHSPDEAAKIPSVEPFFKLLTDVLARVGQGAYPAKATEG